MSETGRKRNYKPPNSVSELFTRYADGERHFTGVMLPGAHFYNPVDPPFLHVSIDGITFEDCDFNFSNLHVVSLKNARIRRCSFQNSVLRWTDLTGATLEGADFANAFLASPDFSGARFHGALEHALFAPRNFSACSVSGPIRMDGTHVMSDIVPLLDADIILGLGYPPYFSEAALRITADRLRNENDEGLLQRVVSFLKRYEVSDDAIVRLRADVACPTLLYRCFISYSHADEKIVSQIYARLQKAGIRCWLDNHEIKPGERILDAVDRAMRVAEKVLLCCSRASLSSWWVKDEVRKAMERERRHGVDVIIPILLDRFLLDEWDDGLAADLRSRYAANFTAREGRSAIPDAELAKLLTVLKVDVVRGDEVSRKGSRNPRSRPKKGG